MFQSDQFLNFYWEQRPLLTSTENPKFRCYLKHNPKNLNYLVSHPRKKVRDERMGS